MPAAATHELLGQLDRAGPFGQGAPAPRFALPALQVRYARPVGETHLKLTLADDSGARLDAIAFGVMENDLGARLLNHNGARFHVAGHLEINHFQGRASVQLKLGDAAPA